MDSISIIIPVYNCSKYLDDALKSVMIQNLSDYEVIIVDDGSIIEENLLYRSIVKNYPNTILVVKNNGGAASARNFGAKIASKKYLAFLDADDIWLEGKLESQFKIINKNKSIGLVLGNIIVSDENLIPKYSANKNLPNNKTKIIKSFFEGKITMNTPTILVRRDIFDAVKGFSDDLRYREDHYFLMNIADISKIICDKKYLTVRRERSNSLSSVTDIISELNKHRPFWKKCNHYYPYLNVQRAEINLLKKLYLFYLRNNRKSDILETIQVTKPISKINYILFSALKGCSKIINLIYIIRNKIKNVRI